MSDVLNSLRRSVYKKGIRSPWYLFFWFRKKILDQLVGIHVVSYPKSGRTWVRYFIAQYFSKLYGVSDDLNFRSLIKRHRKIPRFQFDHHDFKASDVDTYLDVIDALKNKRVLLIIRDPRDVVVSLYNHSQYRQILLDTRGMHISDFIRHKKLGIESIIEYMNLWYDHRETFKDFYMVKYEDLRSEKTTDVNFKSILTFLGQERINEGSFEYAMDKSSFAQMKKAESELKFNDPVLQPTDITNSNSFKVRKGEVSGYKKSLAEDDIKYVNSCMTALNSAFGYRVEN